MSATTETAIALRGATVVYNAGTSIGPVDLDVPRGTVLGLVGSNGAGKTTMLRLLCGLATASRGEVEVLGETVRPGRVPRGLGAMIEEPPVFPWATGRHHLELANVSPGLPRDRIATLLLAVGLGDAEDRPVGTYSQGMRQRLGIARALLADPEVLVLDEPSNGLDPHGIHWLRDLVRERAAAGRTVVVSSHLLAEMQLFADTVVMLAGGAVLSTIALADLPPGSGSLEAYYFATLAAGEGAPSP